MYAKGKIKGSTMFIIKPSGSAKKVELAGDFNGWKPTAMKKQKDGSYVLSVPLDKGAHEYKFLVDGQWLVDPDNNTWSVNKFGTMNSVAQV